MAAHMAHKDTISAVTNLHRTKPGVIFVPGGPVGEDATFSGVPCQQYNQDLPGASKHFDNTFFARCNLFGKEVTVRITPPPPRFPYPCTHL